MTTDRTGIATERAPTRAYVLGPYPARPHNRTDPSAVRDSEARLAEATGLARAVEVEVVGGEVVRLARAVPATLIGKGGVERIGAVCAELAVGLVVVDHPLTPVQQRNLERAWNAKVIDRTGLILEIFGARARTSEGTLQVELAALTYQRSRLVRSWTHLERQRGGFGFLGGPGESQLEIDRRLIGDRMAKLRRELAEVTRTRSLQRTSRQKVPFPVVALVGYTNAGKSTLFNRLSGAGVVAADLLFATLDPTLRRIRLPSGRTIILSDTVGFISELPTELVAAFRATLEEVLGADLILHVRDVSHPDSLAQRADVLDVLRQIGIDTDERPMIEVLNKVDLVDPDERAGLIGAAGKGKVAISALDGDGIGALLAAIDLRLADSRLDISIDVDLADGAALSWLYERGDVIDRQDDDRVAHLHIGLDRADLDRFTSRFAYRPNSPGAQA